MIVIVEGPDASGKTVLAKFIANSKRAIYWHHDYSPLLSLSIQDYFESTHRNLIWCHDHLNADIVMDRGWPSEAVYAQAIGDAERMMRFNPQVIRDMLGNRRVIYIYARCETSLQRHMDSHKDRYQYDMLTYQKIRSVYDIWFDSMMRCPGAQCVLYDMDKSGSNLKEFMSHNKLL